jgi:hypothetical protein
MNHAPWRAPDAQPGSYALGMLGLEERKLLYHLARDVYTGAGAVIDAGCFCGASTCSLAAGLRDNPLAPRGKFLHAYDLFVADLPYIIDFASGYMGRNLAIGDSFRPIYDESVREFAQLIDTHEGDLFAATWDGAKPIEVLFIDAAKSIELQKKILDLFFPSLIPGKSIVVQQDFHHPGAFYIVVAMDYLRDHFTVIEERSDSSVAFRLESAIPREKLAKVGNYEFSPQDQLAAIRRTIRAVRPENRHHLWLGHAVAMGVHYGRQALKSALNKAARHYTHPSDPAWRAHTQWCQALDSDEAICRFNRTVLNRQITTAPAVGRLRLALAKGASAIRSMQQPI